MLNLIFGILANPIIWMIDGSNVLHNTVFWVNSPCSNLSFITQIFSFISVFATLVISLVDMAQNNNFEKMIDWIHSISTIFSRSMIIAIKYATMSSEQLYIWKNIKLATKIRDCDQIGSIMLTACSTKDIEGWIERSMENLHIEDNYFFLNVHAD